MFAGSQMQTPLPLKRKGKGVSAITGRDRDHRNTMKSMKLANRGELFNRHMNSYVEMPPECAQKEVPEGKNKAEKFIGHLCVE